MTSTVISFYSRQKILTGSMRPGNIYFGFENYHSGWSQLPGGSEYDCSRTQKWLNFKQSMKISMVQKLSRIISQRKPILTDPAIQKPAKRPKGGQLTSSEIHKQCFLFSRIIG